MRHRLRSPGQIGFTVVAIGLMLTTARLAGASGFRNPPDGAAALGYSGGKLTLLEDASLISHNPGGLVSLKPQAMAAASLISAGAEFESPSGRAETRDDLKWLPSLYAVMPVAEDADARMGLALTSPYGQSTEWKKDGPFRYAAPYFAEMVTINVSPAFALRVNETLSAGAAADVMFSDLEFKQLYSWTGARGIPGLPDGEARFDASGVGFGAHLGVEWSPAAGHVLALTYRTPVKVEYNGDFDILGAPPGLLPISSSDFDTTIRFPSIVAAGYGFQIRDNLRIGFDVEWVEFSRQKKMVLDISPLNSLLGEAAVIPQDWKDTWTAGVGVDWKVSDPWTLRAGYIFIESPIPSSTMSPILPDNDRHLFSLGAGYSRKAHRVDVAYVYSLIEDREIRTHPIPFYNGTYELSSHLIGLSYAYTF